MGHFGKHKSSHSVFWNVFASFFFSLWYGTSTPGKKHIILLFLAAALYIGWVTLLERAGHCQKQALPHGCLFWFTGASFPGFCYPTLHIFVSPNLAKSSYKKTKKKKKNTGFETPRAFFRFISNPFSFFVSAYFTCLSVFVCLLHCFFAVAPYCSPTSSCARSSERKNAQSGRRTAATPECDNRSTKASNRKQKTRKKNQES